MFPSNLRTLAAVIGSLIGCAAVLADARTSAGEDFRVDNKVFFGSHKTADSQSTTIFHDGMVYDYLERPAEVIVFDKAGKRFVMLDTDRRIRAELSTHAVESFVEQLQQSAARHPDPFIQFHSAPKFEEKFDASASELTLSSPWIIYRLVLKQVDSREIAAQYREFCDWYARLNTILNPGSKPPDARLVVNESLGRHQAIAREVYLTMTLKKGFPPKRVKIRSEHQLIRQVTKADLDRVTQTRQFMDIFKPVSFEQYRQTDN